MISPRPVDGIVWKKAELAQIIPSRELPDPDAVHPDTAGGWATKCRLSRTRNDRRLQFLRTGVEHTPAPLRELAARMLARCSSDDEFPAEADVEAALVSVGRYAITDAVRWWLETRGLEFTLQALTRSFDFTNEASLSGYSEDVGDWLVEAEVSWNHPEYAEAAWRVVRAEVMRTSEEQWRSARDVAQRLFTTASNPARAGLAFAFNDSALADEAIAASLPVFAPWAQRERSVYAPLLARLVGVASSSAVARLLVGNNTALNTEDLYTALAHQGHAAVPTIAAAYRAASGPLKTKIAKVLLAVRTDQAAELLTSWAAERKAIAPVLQKHLTLARP